MLIVAYLFICDVIFQLNFGMQADLLSAPVVTCYDGEEN
jgi:hypothetical protein